MKIASGFSRQDFLAKQRDDNSSPVSHHNVRMYASISVHFIPSLHNLWDHFPCQELLALSPPRQAKRPLSKKKTPPNLNAPRDQPHPWSPWLSLLKVLASMLGEVHPAFLQFQRKEAKENPVYDTWNVIVELGKCSVLSRSSLFLFFSQKDSRGVWMRGKEVESLV